MLLRTAVAPALLAMMALQGAGEAQKDMELIAAAGRGDVAAVQRR